jgi:hypothetical protein
MKTAIVNVARIGLTFCLGLSILHQAIIAAGSEPDADEAIRALRQCGANVVAADNEEVLTRAFVARPDERESWCVTCGPGWHGTTEDLRLIRRLPRVFRLEFESVTSLGDDISMYLKSPRSIKVLQFAKVAISDSFLASINKLENLQELSISETAINEQSLSRLGRLGHLLQFALVGVKLQKDRDSSLPILASPKLGSVTFLASQIPEDYVRQINPGVRRINLGRTGVTDQVADALVKYKALESLDLDYTRVTVRTVEKLMRLEHLQAVSITGTTISEVDVKRIEASLNVNCRKLRGDETRFVVVGRRKARPVPIRDPVGGEKGCLLLRFPFRGLKGRGHQP